jgi:hypothetical protein
MSALINDMLKKRKEESNNIIQYRKEVSAESAAQSQTTIS